MSKRYERLKKFGFTDEERSNPPVEPIAGATFLNNSFYVYGLDLLSSDDVRAYFSKYEIESIGWLNDSSCTLFKRDP